MRISVKIQLTALVSIISFLAIIIGAAVILPSIKSIIRLEADIKQTQLLLERQYQKTKRLRKSANAIEDIKETAQKYALAMIEEGEELEIITKLEQLAEKYNIEQTLVVNLADPKNMPKQNPIKANKIENNIPKRLKQPYFIFSFLNNGKFEDHVRYLKALEDLPQYFIINNLIFENRRQSENGTAPVTLKFDAELYVSTKKI